MKNKSGYINIGKRVKQLFFIAVILASLPAIGQTGSYPSVEKVAEDFKSLLHRPGVALRPSFRHIKTDSVLIEKGFIFSEENEKVPVLVYKPLTSQKKSFPVVICLHGTGGSKDGAEMRNFLYRFARNGIMGVAIDARYHGERIEGGAHGSKEYVEAVKRAWQNKDVNGQEHPFFYDTVFDLWRLTDYLVTRPDVQADRIGMMGVSMGGIETWMAASVDKRIKVAVPVIAAQSFKWSLENNQWHGRVNTIRAAHEQAAKDLGDSTIGERSVRAVWNKLLPGITGEFDCPSMIRLFAPRPLLLLSNEKDQNCPLPGAKIAFDSVLNSYRIQNAEDRVKVHISPGEPHRLTAEHVELTLKWFVKWL